MPRLPSSGFELDRARLRKGLSMAYEEHRSFRLTPPYYMRGRRVKRRLFWFYFGVGMLTLLALVVPFVIGFFVCVHFPFLTGRWIGEALAVFVCPLLSFVGLLWCSYRLPNLLSRMGILTDEEARGFPRGNRSRWPESWLEDVKK